MTTAGSDQLQARDTAMSPWERRQRAAWIDYLRIMRDADRREYEQVELNAWAQLQRRLTRNDELRAAGR